MGDAGIVNEDVELPNISLDFKEWTTEELTIWMKEREKEGGVRFFSDEEIRSFKEAEISGTALEMIDRTVLKEIGIKSIGRQLEILHVIHQLKQNQAQSEQRDNPPDQKKGPKQNGSEEWKRKITRKDQEQWTEPQKNLYRVKINIIRKESNKVWPGNQKIYFQQQVNVLKEEELLCKLSETCSIPELQFGKECIRSHIRKWATEKNRRLTDGYNFEAEHCRAKRARTSLACVSSSSYSSSTSEGGDTESVTSDSENEPSPPQTELSQISPRSAKIVIIVALNANCYDNLSLKGVLIPLSKHLAIKTRGMSKYEMALPIAKKLVEDEYVIPVDMHTPLDFNRLHRRQIKSDKDLTFIFQKQESPKVLTDTKQHAEVSDKE